MSHCLTLNPFVLSSQEMQLFTCRFRFVCVCFSGVQTLDRPEGTEEGQREKQTQRRAAEPQHHHV